MPSKSRVVSFDGRRPAVLKHADFFDERIAGAAKAAPTFAYRREGRSPASTPVDRVLPGVSRSQSAEPLPGANRRVVFRP